MNDNLIVRVDFNQIFGEMLSVLTEPYRTFVETLHAEGRITDQEVAELTAAIRDRGARLGELVQARLQPPMPTDPRPGQH
jgi:hypothetical protein